MSQVIAPILPRACFDLPEHILWLAHCKDGPLPRASAEVIGSLLQTRIHPWDLRWQEDFLDVQQRLRQAGADLLGANATDISLVTSTSTGLEAVAFGFPWEPGDEVIIPAGEFPSNRLPWLALAHRQVTCREIDLWDNPTGPGRLAPDHEIEPELRLLQAISPRTRLMSVSWIRYQDGVRLDLEKLGRGCRERGVPLIVDGIQGAGTITPALKYVSAFATGGHKGLLGPQGQGMLWTDSSFRQQLMPRGTWLSTPAMYSTEGSAAIGAKPWVDDGRYLEAGSPSILSCGALAASIEWLLAMGGTQRIHEHVVSLQKLLLGKLALLPAWAREAGRLSALLDKQRCGSILSFDIGAKASESLLKHGEMLGIHASMREGFLRLAWHGWHSSDDVERCVEWLSSGATDEQH